MVASLMDIDRRTSELRDRAARYAAIYAPIREKLLLSWIYYDQAIEGVALTLPEINGALAGQHRPANDRATEHTFRVIRNLKTAFAWVDSQAALESRPRIDEALVRTLHGIVVDGDPDTVAGSYRAEIPLHRAYFHEIMLPKAIPEAMAKIHEVLDDPELQQQHPIRQAATLHFDLMRIFPFTDHSGTVCRLIAEIILRRHGYPALVIPAVDRQRYYEALRDNVEKLNNLFHEAIDNLTASIHRQVSEHLPKPPAPPRPVTQPGLLRPITLTPPGAQATGVSTLPPLRASKGVVKTTKTVTKTTKVTAKATAPVEAKAPEAAKAEPKVGPKATAPAKPAIKPAAKATAAAPAKATKAPAKAPAQPAAKAPAKAATKPSGKPAPKPAAKAPTKPATPSKPTKPGTPGKPAPQAPSKPAAKAPAKPAAKATAKATAKASAKPAAKSAAKASAKLASATKTVAKPAPKAALKPAAKVAPKAAKKPTPKPLTKPRAKPAAKAPAKPAKRR